MAPKTQVAKPVKAKKTVEPTKAKKSADEPAKLSKKQTLREKRKNYMPKRKNPVDGALTDIRVMKRKAGILRFAKKMAAAAKQSRRNNTLLRKAVKKEANDKMKARAEKAVEGKKDKAGKPKAPVYRKMQKFEVRKMKHSYKTQLAPRTLKARNLFDDMDIKSRPKIAHLRRSLVPGTVCIILAGKYKGRRVVFLKQLKKSGLCLVNGPYKYNAVPLRRMNQNYLIATSVKINMQSVKIPQKINDAYFKKTVPKKKKKEGEEIFASKKDRKTRPTAERKMEQRAVDRQIVKAIKSHKEAKMIAKYLSCKFGIRGRRYPHDIKF